MFRHRDLHVLHACFLGTSLAASLLSVMLLLLDGSWSMAQASTEGSVLDTWCELLQFSGTSAFLSL